jgi:tetratricopeptide (TPR) repeat protein
VATEVSHARLVLTAIEAGEHLLEMGALDEAQTNFTTAIGLNIPLIEELLSDDQRAAKRAAERRLPPGVDMLTFATSPQQHLYRLLRRRGDVATAFRVAESTVGLYVRLAPHARSTAEFLDELGDLAFQAGDRDYAEQCLRQAGLIRELNRATGG